MLSNGLTDLFLLIFSFTSFIFFLFYLGHRHVAGPGAGLGSLTSSLRHSVFVILHYQFLSLLSLIISDLFRPY